MAYLYLDYIFIDVPDDISIDEIRESIEDLIDADVFEIKKIRGFPGKHGRIIEYSVNTSTGQQTALLMFTNEPKKLLIEFYGDGKLTATV